MPRKPRKRPPGHGTVWEQGGNWWIRWREGGRRRTAKFPQRDIAERVLARIVADLAAGRGGLEVERPPTPPLKDSAEKWLERRVATHRSAKDDASRWKVHLGPFFGHCRPEQVTPAEDPTVRRGKTHSRAVVDDRRALRPPPLDVLLGPRRARARVREPGARRPALDATALPQRPRSEGHAVPRARPGHPRGVPEAPGALQRSVRGWGARRAAHRRGARPGVEPHRPRRPPHHGSPPGQERQADGPEGRRQVARSPSGIRWRPCYARGS